MGMGISRRCAGSLNPDRLYATVFEGYEPEGLERDNEAASYWEKHLPKSHIINGNRHDNFGKWATPDLAATMLRNPYRPPFG